MSILNSIELSNQDLNSLKTWVANQDSTFAYFNEACMSSLLLSYIIFKEIGGPNDNLARFLWDMTLSCPAEQKDLKPELISYNGMPGIRITSLRGSKIENRAPGFSDFAHPNLDCLVIFPTLIAQALLNRDIEPVIVRDWVLQAIFAGFDPRTSSYRAETWALINNYSLVYSRLVSDRKMIFQGIHDISEHSLEARSEGWITASKVAAQVCKRLQKYFGSFSKGNVPAHVLPFIAGLLLDELAQKPYYHSKSRILAIHELLIALNDVDINPQARLILTKFPSTADIVLAKARLEDDLLSEAEIRTSIRELVKELKAHTSAIRNFQSNSHHRSSKFGKDVGQKSHPSFFPHCSSAPHSEGRAPFGLAPP